MTEKYDPNLCKATAWISPERAGMRFGYSRQCQRNPVRDGYCQQHHPDTVKAKEDAKKASHDAYWKRQAERHRAERIGAAVIAYVEGKPEHFTKDAPDFMAEIIKIVRSKDPHE